MGTSCTKFVVVRVASNPQDVHAQRYPINTDRGLAWNVHEAFDAAVPDPDMAMQYAVVSAVWAPEAVERAKKYRRGDEPIQWHPVPQEWVRSWCRARDQR